MTTSTVVLALAVFGASAVEMVEALTIVAAAGVTRGWRSALEGTATAALVLAALVIAVGVPLARLVPINVLRVVIGALLLVLGLDWLRKAVLRASGHKALHDEDAIYAKTVAGLSDGPEAPSEHRRGRVVEARTSRRDRFHGRLQGRIPRGHGGRAHRDHPRGELGSSGARSGCSRRRGGRGLRGRVPGRAPALGSPGERHEARRGRHVDELRSLLGRRGLRPSLARQRPHDSRSRRCVRRDGGCAFVRHAQARATAGGDGGTIQSVVMTSVIHALSALGKFWKDFLIGDAPELFAGTLVFVGAALVLHRHGYVAVIVLPLIVIMFLGGSVLRGRAKS